MNIISSLGRVVAVVSFGLGCMIAGEMSADMASGAYHWATHMPYVAMILGAAGAACASYGADLIDG